MIDPITFELISKALDGLSLRQMYIAQNVANTNSPGYQAVSVSFEDALAEASANGLGAIKSAQPTISHLETTGATSEVRMDLELAKASQTALRYGALIDVLSKQMAMSRSIATGGR